MGADRHFARQQLSGPNVRFVPKADIAHLRKRVLAFLGACGPNRNRAAQKEDQHPASRGRSWSRLAHAVAPAERREENT